MNTWVAKMNRRSFLGRGAAILAAATLPLGALAQAASDAILANVHPELRAGVSVLNALGTMSAASLEHQRAVMVRLAAKPAADIPYERREIPGLAGHPSVTIYIINAGRGEGRPAVVHTHGGGFVGGSAASSVASLQDVCRELGCVAVSVEYRLAPETTYRGSIEDNYAALKWLHDNATSLGADPARIAVMGESAGGGHAAILAITARDRGEVPLIFQCLTYPMLDDRTGSTRHMPPHVGRLVWTAESNRFGWASFLGAQPGTSAVPADVIPARVKNLAGLPPAFIGVGSIDLFLDEDIDYARRLNEIGVQTELIVVPGAYHGFDLLGDSINVVREFNTVRLSALRRGLRLA